MSPRRCRQIFQRLRSANPAPKGELEYASPFQLLVAVILSAQATDRSVNAATRELFRVAGTPAAILALGLDGLKRHIRAIGLYNAKAAYIMETSRVLVEHLGGEVPRDRAALEELPGVGRKTANVVLNSGFGEPTLAVDTHVLRVANRTGLARGSRPRAIEDALLACIPPEFLRDAHLWLILLGRHTCKARRPDCPRCPIVRLCEYPHKTAT